MARPHTLIVRVLGGDHPDALQFRNNLAYAYREAGDLGRAVPLYEQTLADCERILGTDHPTTKIVRDNVVAARQQAGGQRAGAVRGLRHGSSAIVRRIWRRCRG
ncbi:tetratricopeptide repeat protein [Herbidospora galbida]|uniref:Tetratricopeptide repeat protein n=1 Tax=Herbidospora galbida TaxID=2575442 RepID=A0A4U3MSR5_9ACTN|nr:tetratricopeptide repeat protein [Herbidospora galbida]TKK91406.1 tetratricopeptide repeat protein [Herbidospora galbida]